MTAGRRTVFVITDSHEYKRVGKFCRADAMRMLKKVNQIERDHAERVGEQKPHAVEG